MELQIQNGDYVPDGLGGFRRLTGGEALLQRVLFRLVPRRGAFPFMPELGSRLYLLPREKPSARQALAVQYAAEALGDEEDLRVTGAELNETAEGLRLTVYLDWQGQGLSAGLLIGEGTDEDS